MQDADSFAVAKSFSWFWLSRVLYWFWYLYLLRKFSIEMNIKISKCLRLISDKKNRIFRLYPILVKGGPKCSLNDRDEFVCLTTGGDDN